MINPREASSLTENNKGKFIDVRSVGEAMAEQLPGSVFLPFDLVSRARLEEMGVADKTPILVCRSGTRAKQAAESLAEEMGEVAVLDGGIIRWKEEGLTTDIGRKAIPLERQVLVAAGSMMMIFAILGFLVSPVFFVLTIFMSGGMIFAGATGACGMARLLVMMPWNKQPMCGGSCAVSESSTA